MKNLIKFFLVVLLFTLSFCIPAFAQTAETGLYKTDTILFDGKPVELKTIVYKDRVYVKLRDICYYLKCDVEVDNEKKIINILKNPNNSQNILDTDKEKIKKAEKVNPGISGYSIKNENINTCMESIIYQSRAYVPIRFFSEVFERKVDWLKDKNMVSINKIPDVVVGSVNGQALYKKDFEYIYNPQYNSIKNNSLQEVTEDDIKKLKDSSFDNLVLLNILLQKAAKGKYTLDQSDYQQVNDTIANNVERYGGIENFRNYLAQNQVSLYQYSNNLKNTLLINKMADDLVKDKTASEEKIKKYYDDNKSMFLEPERVRAKHILFSTVDQNTNQTFDASKKEEIKKKAAEVLAAINAGESFDEQMNLYTEDPGTKTAPDGYTFTRGEMVKEFEDSAFSLKVGEISGLVETQYGYHIIKLEEKIPEKLLALDEVREDLKNWMNEQEKESYLKSLVEQWKSESKIENKMNQE
jgi:foldase protein PrsA